MSKERSRYCWNRLKDRIFNFDKREKDRNYENCSICEEWLEYSNFKKWFDENYYEIEGQRMCLDKDILHKGNKIYNPENCIFVPNNINLLFTKRQKNRGGLPIGVCFNKQANKFQANCRIFSTETEKSLKKTLGLFNTSEEAFLKYKEAKEQNIKVMADYYKDAIPQKLYDAMYNYVVEITD